MFNYKSREEFTQLTPQKKAYYLARLYLRQDVSKSRIPYKVRLFSCINYLKKQDVNTLSIMYNYLTENEHNGLMIWEILDKAKLFDNRRRRKSDTKVKQYEEWNESMLED